MKVTLRNYQDAGVTSLRGEYMQGRDSVLYVLPTGGGKTVIFSHVAEQAARRGNRICILVHRQELLDQTSRSLREIGVRHGLIGAGYSMDLSVGVQIASVQTLVRRLHQIPASFFQLLIVDEAHHAVAGSWAKVISHYSNAKVLGVTATPERLDGRGLGDKFQSMVLGPDSAWLTEQGFLAPARVFAPPSQIDTSNIRTRMGDYDMEDAAEAMSGSAIMGDAVSHYQRHLSHGTAIAFCCNIAHARAVAEAFQEAGIRAAVIDGTLTKDDRRQMISDLGTGKIQVLSSCMIISEGTDVPTVTGAILLRPTQSVSLYLQQVGRALRPAPGKAEAIILDHVGNSLRHGLPDTPREWSLEGRKKRDRLAAPPVKVCPGCYACIAPAHKECPECGHVFEVEKRELRHVEGELQEACPYRVGDEIRMAQPRPNLAATGWIVRAVIRSSGKLIVHNRGYHGGREDLLLEFSQVRLSRRGKDNERAQAKTIEDLKAIAAQRGYSPGWAYHVAQSREAKGYGRGPQS